MQNDPDPYDGPIEAIDGKRPYNMFLWNTEDWWPNGGMRYVGEVPRYEAIDRNFSSRWAFGIVALKDGRFSVEGSVYAIQKNDFMGREVVFDTREKAIRIAAARMIQAARSSRKWSWSLGGLSKEDLELYINWVREIVAMETGRPAPEPVKVFTPPPVEKPSGLPLFDYAGGKGGVS